MNNINEDNIIIKQNNKYDFRNKFNENFPKFQLRIRESEKKDTKGLIEDMAYFNGIKVFDIVQIDNNSNDLKMIIPPNVFSCNYSTFKNRKKSNEIDKYKDSLKNVLKPFQEFFDFELSLVKFVPNDIELIKKVFSKYGKPIEIKKNTTNINDIEQELDKKDEKITKKDKIYYYKFKPFNSKNFDEAIDKIINEEIEFMETRYNAMIDNNKKEIIKGTYFELKFKSKKIIDVNNSDDLKKLKNALVNANYLYNGKSELEKKYQHMLITNVPNIFDGKIVYPFEQEYAIKKYHGKDNGRVDCVYYATNGNKLTDIYFVEVKIKDSVIAGPNGVLSHLADVYNSINNEFYYTTLYKRIKYRFEIENPNINLNITENINKHFYTVFGYEEEQDKICIIEWLKVLNDANLIKQLYEIIKQKTNSKENLNNTEYRKYKEKRREYYGNKINKGGNLLSDEILDKHLKNIKDFGDNFSLTTITKLFDNKICIKYFFDKKRFGENYEWKEYIYDNENINAYEQNRQFVEWKINKSLDEFMENDWKIKS